MWQYKPGMASDQNSFPKTCIGDPVWDMGFWDMCCELLAIFAHVAPC